MVDAADGNNGQLDRGADFPKGVQREGGDVVFGGGGKNSARTQIVRAILKSGACLLNIVRRNAGRACR